MDFQRRTRYRTREDDAGRDPYLFSTLGFGVAMPASWFSFFLFWYGSPVLVVVLPLIPSIVLVLLGFRLLWREGAPDTTPGPGTEKQLLMAVRDSGSGVTPVEAALDTSLTLDEAEDLLSNLASRGHLTVEHRNGALSYVLPGK